MKHIPKVCAFCKEESDRWVAIGLDSALYVCSDCVSTPNSGYVKVQVGRKQAKAEVGIYSCNPKCEVCKYY